MPPEVGDQLVRPQAVGHRLGLTSRDRRAVGEVVAEPLHVWGPADKEAQWERVSKMLDAVGIDPDTARYKYPHEFSGGQCQRISIARALVLEPELIICDEPVSALDVSVQAQVLNLLETLRAEYGVTFMLISHDLAVVQHLCEEVVVMHDGRVVERGTTEAIFEAPRDPYTRALLDAVLPLPATGRG